MMEVDFITSIIIFIVSLLNFILPVYLYYIIAIITLIFMGLILKGSYKRNLKKRQLIWSYALIFTVAIFLIYGKWPLFQTLLLVEAFLVIRAILITVYNKKKTETINYIVEKEIELDENTLAPYVNEDMNDKANKLIEFMINNFNENLMTVIHESSRINESFRNDLKEQISDSIKTQIISEIKTISEDNSTNTMQMQNLIEKKLDKINDNLSNIVSSSPNDDNRDKNLLTMIKTSIEGSLEGIKSNSESKDINMLAGEIAKVLKQEEIDTTITRHIVNEEIREWFIYALKFATNEIDIISPWISYWVIESEFIDLVKNALGRGVTIKIVYGIEEDKYSSKRDDSSEKFAEMLRKRFSKYKNLLLMKKGNTHYKLLICDEKYYVAGSFNFLSFKGDYSIPNTRNEGADYSENKQQIRFKRRLYFNDKLQ